MSAGSKIRYNNMYPKRPWPYKTIPHHQSEFVQPTAGRLDWVALELERADGTPWGTTLAALAEANYVHLVGEYVMGDNAFIPHFDLTGKFGLIERWKTTYVPPWNFDGPTYALGSIFNQVPPLEHEEIAVIEKAMRIGLEAFNERFSCGGCEHEFRMCGVDHTVPMKERRIKW